MVVLVGPTASGKNTIKDKLLRSDNFVRVVTTTTRSRRNSELSGYDYNFTEVEIFDRMISEGEVIAYEKINNNMYGLEKREIGLAIKTGKMPILIMSPNGASELEREFRSLIDIVIIYIYESVSELEERMNYMPVSMSRDSMDIEQTWIDSRDYSLIIKNSDIAESILKIESLIFKY